ncbi:MAG TPA: hypothetical protein VK324_02285 [Tepidisphaeraceae bacterium]|nr:hypothetical protein [Tepidisphaeraceae bacterium]
MLLMAARSVAAQSPTATAPVDAAEEPPPWQKFARLHDGPSGTCVVADVSYEVRPEPVDVRVDQNRPLLLALSEDRANFVLTSPDGEMLDWPDWVLLARWWVDGRPAVPPRRAFIPVRMLGRGMDMARAVEVGFALPDNLGPIAVGQRVAVQLMYAPGGFQYVVDDPQRRNEHPLPGIVSGAPQLSNVLEFEVTQDVLDRADRPLEPGRREARE